jgi:hypothetical protein
MSEMRIKCDTGTASNVRTELCRTCKEEVGPNIASIWNPAQHPWVHTDTGSSICAPPFRTGLAMPMEGE